MVLSAVMGSRQEKHPHRNILQARVDELEAQQKLGVTLAESVDIEAEETGQLNVNTLLIANRRFERSSVDFAWLNVLLKRNLRAKEILKIWEIKDEISRTMDGNND